MTSQRSDGRRVVRRGSPDRGVALLWHGRGIDGADWMLTLADQVAAAGVLALCPDWDSEAADRGRGDLLSSLSLAREVAQDHGRDPDTVVIAGWSLGGTAAAGLAISAEQLGTRIGGAVLVAPGDGPRVTDPVSGAALPATMPTGTGQCTIDLVYGERDTSATPDLVTGLELRLRVAGWRTSLHALDTDHAGVVGTRFDARTEHYRPSSAPHATAAAAEVAAVVVAAATA